MTKKSSYYELLYDFILNTSPDMSFEELAERFIDIAGRSLSVKLLGVFIYDSKNDRLVRIKGGYVAVDGDKVRWIRRPLILERGKGIIWSVFNSKNSVLIKDISSHPDYYIKDDERGYTGKHAFIVPIAVRGNVKCILYAEKDKGFTKEERKFMESVGHILEKTFENSELVARLKRERQEKVNILNSIAYPIFLVDSDFHIKEYNRFFIERFGTTPEEIKKKRCFEIVEKENQVPENCPLYNLLKGKENATAKITIDDRIFEASIFSHVSIEGEELFVHTIKDITELEKKEKNLNMLYRMGLSLATSVSIDEFRIKVEEFVSLEKEIEVKIFWRDGVENNFDYRRPLIKRVKSIGQVVLEPGKSYSFPVDYLGEEVGMLLISPKKGKTLPVEKVKFYKTFAASVELALQNLYLLEELRKALSSLNVNYKATLESLSHALDYREHETEFHSRRVATYAVLIGKRMELSESELKNLYWGGLLHDLGKIGIPDSILLKPAKLTPLEWEVMKKHPVIGFDILKHIEFLQESLKVVLYHHERWDGKGYPYGLEDSEIPLIARIFSIADTYDAITSDRPYRKALSADVAYAEIEKNGGLQFDPDISSLFVKKIKREELFEIRKKVQEDIYYSPIK